MTLLCNHRRCGKARTVNRLIQEAATDLVLITDASAMQHRRCCLHGGGAGGPGVGLRRRAMGSARVDGQGQRRVTASPVRIRRAESRAPCCFRYVGRGLPGPAAPGWCCLRNTINGRLRGAAERPGAGWATAWCTCTTPMPMTRRTEDADAVLPLGAHAFGNSGRCCSASGAVSRRGGRAWRRRCCGSLAHDGIAVPVAPCRRDLRRRCTRSGGAAAVGWGGQLAPRASRVLAAAGAGAAREAARFGTLAQIAYPHGFVRWLSGRQEGIWRRPGVPIDAADGSGPPSLRVRSSGRGRSRAGGLMVFAPVMLAVSIAIAGAGGDHLPPGASSSDRRQPELSSAMLKFRSMALNAEAITGPVWARTATRA